MIEDSVYNAFAKIVGSENITRDPATCDTYAFHSRMELHNVKIGKGTSRFGQRPGAALLPASTEEVQAVVKLCNEHNVTFKAFSTGYGPWASVSIPRSIVIDLRRMNRILHVDKDNMYAVIEPYVTNQGLQAELFKYGLMHHAHGAGPQVSPLASHTAMAGPGFTSPYTGHSGRNLLGAEWVLPTGEVLRLGSFDQTGEWFSGDGPGLSLRGVIRGIVGSYGGLGVFTKCAIRLFSWPAPADWKWRISGTMPNYEWNTPPYWRMYALNFPDWETFEAAYYELNDRDICMVASTSSSEGLASLLTNTKEAALEAMFAGLTARAQRYAIVLISAHTKREFEFRCNVVKAITEKYGGEDLIGEEAIVPTSGHYAEAVRNMFGQHVLRLTDSFESTHGGMDAISMAVRLADANQPLKQKYIDKGLIGDDRGEGIWLSGFEAGHMAHLEVPTLYNATSEESILGWTEYLKECNEMDMEQAFAVPFFVVGDKEHDNNGPRLMNYPKWLRKIKAAFDPNGVSDSSHYISVDSEGMGK